MRQPALRPARLLEMRQRKMSTMATDSDKATAEAIFSLFNLGCSSCSGIIERKLKKLSGIKGVSVDYVTDTVLVDYDPAYLTAEDIRAFIKKLGYAWNELNSLSSRMETRIW